jgi:uncharacterized protein (TIGR04255 family)
MTMPKQSPYKKPPIVEAVIAVHFSVPLDQKEIDAFAKKNKSAFPFREEIVSFTFNLQTKEQHASKPQKVGYKFSSADRTRLVLIQPAQFGVIQQAPYAGWDTFYKEARAHWDDLKKITSYKPVARVSARYVNRIDIPVGINGQIDLRNYFNVGLSLPNYAEKMALQNFYLNCALLHPNTQFINVLQFAAVPSPLIDHLSFTIDIDVASMGAVPAHEGQLWELIDSLRAYKNDLFEACVTDETRKQFQ